VLRISEARVQASAYSHVSDVDGTSRMVGDRCVAPSPIPDRVNETIVPSTSPLKEH